jgi:hypothetical protein
VTTGLTNRVLAQLGSPGSNCSAELELGSFGIFHSGTSNRVSGSVSLWEYFLAVLCFEYVKFMFFSLTFRIHCRLGSSDEEVESGVE